MTEEETIQTAEDVARKEKSRASLLALRKFGAVAMTSAVALVTAGHNLIQPEQSIAAAVPAKKAEQLPERGKRVTPEVRRLLRESNFRLTFAYKGYEMPSQQIQRLPTAPRFLPAIIPEYFQRTLDFSASASRQLISCTRPAVDNSTGPSSYRREANRLPW